MKKLTKDLSYCSNQEIWDNFIQREITLALFTTFKIGGTAQYFIEVKRTIDLERMLYFAKQESLPVFVLGKGSNILVSSKGFEGLVIKSSANRIYLQEKKLSASSGASLQEIIQKTYTAGLSGFEHFTGIPSTIGGALWQNVHFLSPDRSRTVFIDEVFHSARIFNLQTGQVNIFNKDQFCFGYDQSILRQDQNLVVLSARFELLKKSKTEMRETIIANNVWRLERHPPYQIEPSAGSVFKKIENIGAGRLIEQVGLKGFCIGGVQVSQKHANFIINTGNATSDDVLALIDIIQERVHRITGYQLETEIRFVGIT